MDISFALVGLLVLAPVMLAIALLVAARSGRPILYREPRVGLHGQVFTLLKFRTLYPGSTTLGSIAPEDDPRITPVGLPLRRSRLDELPQLYNVLIGDMSLVGPRPMVQAHADALDEATRNAVLSVRPGVTDPASVLFFAEDAVLAGRPNAEQEYFQLLLPAKAKVQLDYLQHWHLMLDFRIILRTVARVWSARAREDSKRRVQSVLALRESTAPPPRQP
ncbi:UDP-glucose:undecaprenyl-phosphate glucose-1-phosphate transferase [Halioglobus japonicus]|nr:UDP-glucose:undecaprenyl-phosphate glucose-1-phosphate transferase [Halioglobus japonicus]